MVRRNAIKKCDINLLMNYQIENWSDRILFVFYTNKVSFDEFSNIIDKVVQPDTKSKIEVTSWTEAFAFKKNEIDIYFEHFYYSDQFCFSFELLPLGNDCKKSLSKLESIVKSLDVMI